ncbi:DUF418 domain-containing protein [Sphingomonas sp. FW199]|uniref:DUF418 domain-containing protein n=1 Tax=Sphingomonas sp. FW199 TaxID=3400217 RepID=UPI003CF21092
MTTGAARYSGLDAVRGVAVMGILLMNIVAFSMPQAAYFNPYAYGGTDPVNLGVYLVNFVLFDGKMRGLFSFLFGASMLLIAKRAAETGGSAARTHYLRMAWLFAFGMAHLLLIWWGDILNHYALIGCIAFLMRYFSVRKLIWGGVGLLVVQLLVVLLLLGFAAAATQPDAAPELAKAAGELRLGFGIPLPNEIADALALHRGSYAGLVAYRFDKFLFSPIGGLLQFGWETLAYMMFGMAAFKSGLLTGEWSASRLRRTALIGFGIGLPAYVGIAYIMVHYDFGMVPVIGASNVLTVPFRPLMILGWACVIVDMTSRDGPLTRRLAATGRMAFTNYLMTSIVMTTLFYGYGFGLFGYLNRWQIYIPVLGMWAAMLIWSPLWLSRYRFGPFEWAWRSLARWQVQPMRGPAIA